MDKKTSRLIKASDLHLSTLHLTCIKVYQKSLYFLCHLIADNLKFEYIFHSVVNYSNKFDLFFNKFKFFLVKATDIRTLWTVFQGGKNLVTKIPLFLIFKCTRKHIFPKHVFIFRFWIPFSKPCHCRSYSNRWLTFWFRFSHSHSQFSSSPK